MSDQISSGDVAGGFDLSRNISHPKICNMAQCVASAVDKSSHFQMLSRLPVDVRKRLRALRKLQMQTSAVEMELHRKEFELEKEFQAKHQEIFRKRFEIITGIYEPNDEECDMPDPEILNQIDISTEIAAKQQDDDKVDNRTAGVPQFWFHILHSNPSFDYLIDKDDEPILKHLIDIRTTYKLQPQFSFILEFEFSPNPFFENSILTKEYLLKMNSDDLISYEGPSIYKTIGCDILWKTEKLSGPSIFDFFNPPQLPDDLLDPSYEEIKNILENDFEIGDYVKDNIVPKAILYFTGERNDSDLEDSTGSEGSDTESDVDEQYEGEKLK